MNRLFTFLILFFIFISLGYSLTPNNQWYKKVSHEAGLDSARGGRIWVVDVNNDNYPDLFWGEGGINKNHLHLFLNVPNPDKNSPTKRIFVEWTDSSGIQANRDSTKTNRVVDIMAAADLNNDGNIDLVTSIYYHRLQYYQNGQDPGDRSEVMLGDGKGHFTLKKDAGVYDLNVDDTLPRGLINATGMSYLDYDYDGNIDLYISTWFTDYAAFNGLGTNMPDVMLKGNGDGSFTRMMTIGLEKVVEPEYGVDVTDYDNDGWQDIITSPYCRSGGALFRNLHDGTFFNNTYASNYSAQKMQGDNGQNLCQWSAQPGDFDNDGDMDLLQVEVHGGYDAGEGRTHISVNSGPSGGYSYNWEIDRIKRDAPNDSHLGDQGGNWIDFDNDGWLDLMIGQSAYPQANLVGQEHLYICHQDTDHVFRDFSKILGTFWSVKEAHTEIPVDFDLDGDQDILVSHLVRDTQMVNGNQVITNWEQIELLRNDSANVNAWASYKLKATSAGTNKSCLGARLIETAGGMNQIREIQAGIGHFGQQLPFIQHFGLGNSHYIDSITVRWPRKDLLTTAYKYPPLRCVSELDDSGELKVIKTWEGNQPVIAFSPQYFNFGQLSVGSFLGKNTTITNLGDGDLVIDSCYFPSEISGQFSISFGKLPLTLKPNESADLILNFGPKFRGDFSGSMIVHSNAFNTPVAYVDFKAEGMQDEPMVTSDKASWDYQKVIIDTLKETDFDIVNFGELPLSVTGFVVEDGNESVFRVEPVSLPFNLNPGEKQKITVSFRPKAEKSYQGTVSLISNAFNNQKFKIQLYGQGDSPKPQIACTPGIFLMGSVQIGQSVQKTAAIYNPGNFMLSLKNITVQDSSMTDIFTFPDVNLPTVVKPGDTLFVNVQFAPKEEKQYSTKLILISDAVNDSAKTVTIRGTGLPTSVAEQVKSIRGISVRINPNPFGDFSTIYLTASENTNEYVNISLYDSFGRKIETISNGLLQSNISSYSINSAGITSGIYFVNIVVSGETLSIPVMILK